MTIKAVPAIPGPMGPLNKRAGIRDVARLAGVSTATVSRALANGMVSPELRARVDEAVALCGYMPDLTARRLSAHEAGTIGLLLADIRNPFFTAFSRAVEVAAFRRSLRVILCNTDEDPQREALALRLMEQERVNGIIFAPTQATLDRAASMQRGIPIVLFDRAGADLDHDAVVLDNQESCAQLVAHLYQQGCRRIAGLFGSTSSTGRDRRSAFEAALAAHDLPILAQSLMPYAAAGEEATEALLRMTTRPDALLGGNGRLLMGAWRAIRARGLKVPEDLALAGFDDEEWTGLVDPGVTVIAQPVERFGETALSMLAERMAQPALAPRTVVLTGQLITRGSTRLGEKLVALAT